jgi:hypothetical protein
MWWWCADNRDKGGGNLKYMDPDISQKPPPFPFPPPFSFIIRPRNLTLGGGIVCLFKYITRAWLGKYTTHRRHTRVEQG